MPTLGSFQQLYDLIVNIFGTKQGADSQENNAVNYKRFLRSRKIS